jgi:hypothetical protein
MDERFAVLETTEYSLRTDGKRPAPWKSVRSHLAEKTCTNCGKSFRPWRRGSRVMPEASWSKQRFCSISCSKKLENPMADPAARQKMKARLREIGHKPRKQGGNGRLRSLPHLALAHALGEGWESEVVVPTKIPKGNGYPTCYKIDIANRELMIGIEINGGSHCSIERQMQDRKKLDLLASLGWSVYRVSNERALCLYSTFKSRDTLLTLLMES